MISSLLRLFALRPFLGAAIMGIPVLLLIALGLAVVWAFKFFVFIVLPVVVALWLFRKISRAGRSAEASA